MDEREAAWDAVHGALPPFRRIRRPVVVALALIALLAMGCNPAPLVVDGWQLGGVEACADTPFGGDNTVPCDVQMREIIAVATAALDRRDPGHGAVIRAQIHSLGSRSASGGTGATVVVVFDIADGRTNAIGVGHRIPDPGEEHDPAWPAFEYGPMRRT